MPNQIKELLQQYVHDIHDIYGNTLKAVILYGSYARGDFNDSSDVDIMILVDATDEAIRKNGERISDITFDFNMDHDILIMPIVKNSQHFQYWLSAYPFYENVRSEGVELYVA